MLPFFPWHRSGRLAKISVSARDYLRVDHDFVVFPPFGNVSLNA